MFDNDERWPFVLLLVGCGLIVLHSALALLEIAFGIFVILSILIVGGAILFDALIMAEIGIAIDSRVRDDRLMFVIRVIGVAGSVAGAFHMVHAISEIDWAKWSVREFYSAMEPSRNPLSPGGKSVIDPDVLPAFLAVWKALFINIGGVLWAFISNMLAPWSWLSATVGLFLGDR